jgi:hypothetical protein
MPKSSAGFPEATEEIIRLRAYQLYEQRGSEPGHDLDDWLQAELEILGKTRARARRQTAASAMVTAA